MSESSAIRVARAQKRQDRQAADAGIEERLAVALSALLVVLAEVVAVPLAVDVDVLVRGQPGEASMDALLDPLPVPVLGRRRRR